MEWPPKVKKDGRSEPHCSGMLYHNAYTHSQSVTQLLCKHLSTVYTHGQLKLQDRKLQNWKYTDNCMGGK